MPIVLSKNNVLSNGTTLSSSSGSNSGMANGNNSSSGNNGNVFNNGSNNSTGQQYSNSNEGLSDGGSCCKKGSSCKTYPCLIFEDNFDTLNFCVWEHEITAGGNRNSEFQYYTNNRTNSYVRNGTLFIKPVCILV